MKKYLSDMISENEVSNWKQGDSILISSPTGSGKSSFVLRRLLPQAISKNKHILYFCNRKILKEQLKVSVQEQLNEFFGECSSVEEEYLRFIHIVTYQHCELTNRFVNLSFQNAEGEEVSFRPDEILYYVFDEAHYFLCDALFNSNTCFWVGMVPTKGINLFLTATPEPLLYFLATTRSAFGIDDQLLNIYNLCKEKAVYRRELETGRVTSRVLVDLKNKSSHMDQVTNYTCREIDLECRKINPYEKSWCDAAEQRKKLTIRELPIPKMDTDYQSYNEYYFSQYNDLFPKMLLANEQEKWLVFVDIERDGIELMAKLEQCKISAMLLSKDTIGHKCEAETFHDIVESGRFNCSVLIATEVMDCGVSITDPAVKHIVLSHTRKTTFLQMAGRRRLENNENINIYIRFFSIKQINGIIHQLNVKMRLLATFALRNKMTVDQARRPTKNGDGMRDAYILSSHERKKCIPEIFRPQNLALVHYTNLTGHRPSCYEQKEFEAGRHDILEEYEYSRTAFASLLYELLEYTNAQEIYRVTGDPCFYLKQQLEWLEKTYDESKWVTQKERMDAVLKLLAKYQGKWISKSDQIEFSRQCLGLLMRLPVPPIALARDASRYTENTGKVPGIKKLNNALQEKKVPYQIISKQKYVPNKQTCWCIVEC